MSRQRTGVGDYLITGGGGSYGPNPYYPSPQQPQHQGEVVDPDLQAKIDANSGGARTPTDALLRSLVMARNGNDIADLKQRLAKALELEASVKKLWAINFADVAIAANGAARLESRVSPGFFRLLSVVAACDVTAAPWSIQIGEGAAGVDFFREPINVPALFGATANGEFAKRWRLSPEESTVFRPNSTLLVDLASSHGAGIVCQVALIGCMYFVNA